VLIAVGAEVEIMIGRPELGDRNPLAVQIENDPRHPLQRPVIVHAYIVGTRGTRRSQYREPITYLFGFAMRPVAKALPRPKADRGILSNKECITQARDRRAERAMNREFLTLPLFCASFCVLGTLFLLAK